MVKYAYIFPKFHGELNYFVQKSSEIVARQTRQLLVCIKVIVLSIVRLRSMEVSVH